MSLAGLETHARLLQKHGTSVNKSKVGPLKSFLHRNNSRKERFASCHDAERHECLRLPSLRLLSCRSSLNHTHVICSLQLCGARACAHLCLKPNLLRLMRNARARAVFIALLDCQQVLRANNFGTTVHGGISSEQTDANEGATRGSRAVSNTTCSLFLLPASCADLCVVVCLYQSKWFLGFKQHHTSSFPLWAHAHVCTVDGCKWSTAQFVDDQPRTSQSTRISHSDTHFPTFPSCRTTTMRTCSHAQKLSAWHMIR